MVIPSGKRSWAAVLARAQSPVRDRFESDNPGIGCLIEKDVIRQMRPQPPRRIQGTASRTRRTEVVRLALTAAAICSSVRSRRPCGRGAACVGDQDVQASETLGRFGDQSGRHVGRRDVCHDGVHVAAERQ
ncbi:MAG: hypothetical protein QOE07_2299 [Acidimicrobiaceae bacterium]|jgi:hypothetical protein|nr:hypothetical protein [Acidimicrobiaceae bacterium]MDQ1413711.1 hypothetical protein [Acidimicrobiaceae bacterium]MDQ1417773.1 hypothetical protein [Acidimicrobiaceae bacterium]